MNYSKSPRLKTSLILLALAATAFAQKENMETIADFHHISAYIVAALMIAVFVMIFSNRVYYYREKEIRTRARQINTQLGLVLDANNTQIFTYDISKKMYTLFSDNGEKRKEYSPIDFSQFFDSDEFRQLRSYVIKPIVEGRKESDIMLVRGQKSKSVRRIYEISISVLHRYHNGDPKVLLGIQHDITNEGLKREEARKLSMRFHNVFNSSLIDMIFYDENLILSDINAKACETFGVTDRRALLERKVSIRDIPSYRDIDFDHFDSTQLSSITDIDRTKQTDERIPELHAHGKLYYEVSLTAIRDKSGKLLGVIAAGRNITEMVQSHHRQLHNSQLLKKATLDIRQYVDNINYTLNVSGARIINYNPDTHILEIASDLSKSKYRLSQIRCAYLIAPSQRAFMDTLETIFRDSQRRPIYQTFNMVPVVGKDGIITNYFGMARNDTEMHFTEMRLQEETLKAQETEELKNTFLKNMSYEIRTPLNAVLGFAELFNGPHDESDEPLFAQEIKRNTSNLLSLINDILFISRLDARMVEFNYKECDFATQFDANCYMGLSIVNPGVNISVDNPYSLLNVVIDDQNLGMVISKICGLAARNTIEGSIRAKCEYRHGELNIAVEFTDPGLSPEEMNRVFQRFAASDSDNHSGTGLDLPIIKELVEQMGGSIEVQSEQGKGSSVYVIIPCEMKQMERKTEMANII